MNEIRITLFAAAVLALLAAGCDGPSSARETRLPDPAGAADPQTAAAPESPPAGTTARSSSKPDQRGSAALPPRNSRGLLEASFDDVKFDMEKTGAFKRSMLTPKVEAMFGERIRIRGYMFPTLRQRGLTQFVLVRDNLECCFGPGAALFDCILITMQPGKTAEYSIRPIMVEGEFQFGEQIGPDGRHLAIYKLVGEAVE